MRDGTFFETLRCELTEAEKFKRGEQLAANAMRIAEHREQTKEEKKTLEKEHARLTSARYHGIEDREEECFDQPNIAAGTIETIRLDTGEVIRDRKMDPMERKQASQGELRVSPAIDHAVRAAQTQRVAASNLAAVPDAPSSEPVSEADDGSAPGAHNEYFPNDDDDDDPEFNALPPAAEDDDEDDDLPEMGSDGEPV